MNQQQQRWHDSRDVHANNNNNNNNNIYNVRRRDRGMDIDQLADAHAEKGPERFQQYLVSHPEIIQQTVDLVVKHRGGNFVKFHPPIRGGYSCLFRVELDDGWAAMRVPLPGLNTFLDEKTRAEANMMRYVAENTTVPVPRVYHWGYASENPAGTGPFIIMEFFPGTDTLAEDITDPEKKVLKFMTDPCLTDESLQEVFQPLAGVLLQLDGLRMPKIGSLVREEEEDGGGSWAVGSRPLPQSVCEVVTQGGCPESVLADEGTTYSSSAEYYASLANLHMAHFAFQHNNAVTGIEDARDKYMARHLFRRLNDDGSVSRALRDDFADASSSASGTQRSEAFRLVCDDLSPSNILVDGRGKLVAVIDWEFAYFGPASMASAPPWWLPLCKPQDWREGSGFDDWVDRYPRLLGVFLKALEAEEAKMTMMKTKTKTKIEEEEEAPLSVRMRRSWESGDFWITWAARSSFGFDPVYWKFLDGRFFGEKAGGGYEGRMGLLSEEERRTMERVVQNKVDEDRKPELWRWKPVDVQRYLKRMIGRPRV